MKPLLICAAVTGGGPPKAKTPHHPVTVEEIVSETLACWRAGAAMVHVHGRTPDGQATADPTVYNEILERLRAAGCDVIVNLSAGDVGGRATHEQRLAVARVDAEVVSLDAGSFNTGDRLYNNAPGYLEAMAAAMLARGIKAEVEVFDTGHLDGVRRLAAKGLLPSPVHLQFVFGVPGTLIADVRLLHVLLGHLPEDAEWGVATPYVDPEVHVRLMMAALTMGGHVRTGMEDQVYLRPGVLARSNAEMVEQWVRTAQMWGRPVASPEDARAMLKIPSRAGARAPGAA